MRGVLLWIVILLVLGGETARLPIRGTYESARQEAIREGKALLLLLLDPGDPRGADLVNRMMRDPGLRQALGEKTVLVLIRRGSTSRYPIELYYTTRFPALFLIDPSRELTELGPVYDWQSIATHLYEDGNVSF